MYFSRSQEFLMPELKTNSQFQTIKLLTIIILLLVRFQ